MIGRCLCGHYRFEASGDPLWVAYCHCESCRRVTGSPATGYVGFADTAVRFERTPPVFASSPAVRRAFCEHCSTPLYYAADFFPGELHLFRTNFERPESYQPTRHVLFNEHEVDFEIYDDLPRYGTEPGRVIAWGPKPAIRVLFLCAGNDMRSILAEALLNLKQAEVDGVRMRGHSAGSLPTGKVDPRVLALLSPYRHRLDRPKSRSWDAFTSADAPSLDWVITLCDNTAAETFPVFPGQAQRQHWHLPESDAETDAAMATVDATWAAIEQKVDAFLAEVGATAPG